MEVRYLDRCDYEVAEAFLRDHWQHDHVYVRDRDLFDWTFGRRCHWEGSEYSFAAAFAGGRCVGVLGGIPFDLFLAGTKVDAIWFANWMVQPDYRRTPAGMLLLSAFRRPNIGAFVSFGINPAVARLYRALRWKVVDAMPRLVGLFEDMGAEARRMIKGAHPEIEMHRVDRLVRAFSMSCGESPPVTEGSFASGEDAAALDLWERKGWRCRAKSATGASRDRSYLAWRYLAHPRFEYKVLVDVTDERAPGLAVWRLETVRLLEDGVRLPLCRFARLLELMPSPSNGAERLVTRVLADARKDGAVGLDHYNFDAGALRLLAVQGLKYITAVPDGGLMPARFQPLDVSSGTIMSAFSIPALSAGVEAPPLESWYWTKSDSDQDRPN